mmetsp:Transcript_15178/g.19820  ORF Transcript_15178/g.19820 Transcript_15178/m.19820 type:complete len:306 (+) Transcript_15178:2-919(+)
MNPSHYWVPPQWLVKHPKIDDKDDADDSLYRWFTAWQRQQKSWFSKSGQNPGVYFNITPGLKYGIVQVEDLLEDLRDWKYMYLAGRMHKPTLGLSTLVEENAAFTQTVQAQSEHNLPAALSSALLLLSSPSKSSSSLSSPRQMSSFSCSEVELYHTIAGLSYHGDFRMKMAAEDPQKVQRLVESSGQLPRFRALYQPAIQKLVQQGVLYNNNEHQLTWDLMATTASTTTTTRAILQQQLPTAFRTLNDNNMKNNTEFNTEFLSQQLAARVAASARIQSAKGLVTAGPSKAFWYAARKLSKGLLRR